MAQTKVKVELGRLHDGSDESRPTKVVRVCDLPETPPPGVSLYCPECDEAFSASRGDYFLSATDAELRCMLNSHWKHGPDGQYTACGEPLQLVRRVVEYLPWKG